MDRKKVYNIILNSKDTATYTGTKDKAQYFIDFTNIMDASAMKSAYLVKFRIKSLVMDSTKYNPASNLIILNLGITTAFHNMYNQNWSQIAGAITFEWEGQPTSTTNNYSIDTLPESNPPVYVDFLCPITFINFNLYDVNSSANFSNVADYVCILSFIEQ